MPPEGAIWVPVAQPSAPLTAPEDDDTDTATRSEPASPMSHRKHVGAVAAAGGIVGGVALWQAFGVIGLLAGGGAAAGLVAAPVAAYALYKRRGRNRTPMGRALRGRRTTGRLTGGRRTASRLGSTGLGRGKGRLGGGHGGPKLGGGRSGKLLGGKGAKLGGGKAGLGKGKSGLGGSRSKGGLLGSKGRGGKLLSGNSRGGKLLGGGRGSGLGGKLSRSRKGGAGLGLGRGRKTSAAGRSGGLTSRAGRGGLKLGKRGGRAAHGAVGRWSKSSAAGAGILSKRASAAARRRASNVAQRAAKTRAGRRISKAVQAARRAHGASVGKSPFARWRAATRAAHSQMPGTRSYSNWATGIGAGVLALLALLELRFKTWRAKRGAQATDSAKATGGTGRPTGSASDRSSTGYRSSWTQDSDAPRRTPFTPPPQPPPTIKVEVIRDEPVPPRALTGSPLAIGPSPAPQPIRKENRMGSFPLLAAAEEFSAAAAKYAPESAHGLAPDFDQLPVVIANLAAGFRNYAQRIHQTEPVHQAVTEALFDLFAGVNKLVSTAETIGPLHRQVHDADIARVENPRPNEARWNAPV
jgi:hypothetical protein